MANFRVMERGVAREKRRGIALEEPRAAAMPPRGLPAPEKGEARDAFLSALRSSGRYKYSRYNGLPLRYAGGKSLAVGHVVENIPYPLPRVVSPFIGGGSVEIACAKELGVPVRAYDVFDVLANYWEVQLSAPQRLADRIRQWEPTQGCYRQVKQRLKEHWTRTRPIEDALELAAHYWFNHNLSYGPASSGGCPISTRTRSATSGSSPRWSASPADLRGANLVEVLDWAAAALDRVDKDAFFAKFNESEAVPYFYEPFLEAFDPGLRRQMGVWYTPPEVVRYMVARVDKALRDDLGVDGGLAAENVYVLDPCCGTGTYLAETLRRIEANLRERGAGALTGALLKRAAAERVFGFEIMPAPLVIAHLQVGLAMQALGAGLENGADGRLGIFLTNALTGWEPAERLQLPFPALEEERERAERVKQETPVLVIIGNPPYNGFADMAMDEERELTEAYRSVKRAPQPEGQGLNDLYVRFFRMAERRIAEKTGKGIVCYISNYSWLDGLSHPGMRERYLEAFDAIRVDCLNGDTRKGGKTPDGAPDRSVFTVPSRAGGIMVGTAIATLVRKSDHKPSEAVQFRHLWGEAKREELTATADAAPGALYEDVKPNLALGLPFMPVVVDDAWANWPSLQELMPQSFPGVKTSRDLFLVDIDKDRLKERMADYFDASISHEEMTRRYPRDMTSRPGYDAPKARDALLARGGLNEAGFVRYAYRPFDNRWLYWEAESDLLNRERADYKPHVAEGNPWLVTQRKPRREWSPPQVITAIGCIDLIDRSATCIPASLQENGLRLHNGRDAQRRPNLSESAERYLGRLGLGADDLFHHVVAALHDPAYREANAGALRMAWPRIPLPGWPNGGASDAEWIAASAARGRTLAALLDADSPVDGVTAGALRPELAAIAAPSTTDGRDMRREDFYVTAGWGYVRPGDGVMSGAGRAVERAYADDERAALGGAIAVLGETTYDVYLNDRAYWRNVPAAVWNYRLGGYQVLKKWLSYREERVLERALSPDETRLFAEIARRIAAILILVTER